jgi:hypothetical protein
MEPTSNAVEQFLVSLDPTRGLVRICEDVERVAKLDPKLRAATELLQEQFGLFIGESRETLDAVLWAYARVAVKQPGSLDGFREWIDEGDVVLRTVEDALRTVFVRHVLNELVQRGTELMATDSPSGSELLQARDELRQLEATNSVVPLLAAAGIGVVDVYLVVVRGYTFAPPPPPPPPPPPQHLKARHPYP